jgi:hypothetical protein
MVNVRAAALLDSTLRAQFLDVHNSAPKEVPAQVFTVTPHQYC